MHFTLNSYFQAVLNSSRLPSDTNEIQLLNDGSWSAHDSSSDANCLDTPRKSTQKVEVISDDIGKIFLMFDPSDPRSSMVLLLSINILHFVQ